MAKQQSSADTAKLLRRAQVLQRKRVRTEAESAELSELLAESARRTREYLRNNGIAHGSSSNGERK